MNDKQLVRITMFVLLVGIVLVYAVFFNTQGESLAAQATVAIHQLFSSDGETGAAHTLIATGKAMTGVAETIEQKPEENTGTTVVFSGLNQLFGDDSTEYMSTGVQILSGTDLFQGSMDILKTIGMNYEYILKDQKYAIYYVYIGRDKSYNFSDIAREFGGKAIEIYAQKDIINNLYFGDRVTFMELPQYKDVKVNVFIQYGKDLWMIQDNASQYRDHKKHIRQLFTGK